MRQERIDAVVEASVALEIGAQTALVQGQTQLAAVYAYAVLAVVEDGDAEAGLGEVGIFMVEHLELRLFNAVVAGGRALYISELDIEAGELLSDGGIERRLEEAVVILPIHDGIETHLGAVRKEYHILRDGRFVAYRVLAADNERDGAVGNYFAADELRGILELLLNIGVNIPVIPIAREILR